MHNTRFLSTPLLCFLTAACGSTGFVDRSMLGAEQGDAAIEDVGTKPEPVVCLENEVQCLGSGVCVPMTCSINVEVGPVVGSFSNAACGQPISCVARVVDTATNPLIQLLFESDVLGRGGVNVKISSFKKGETRPLNTSEAHAQLSWAKSGIRPFTYFTGILDAPSGTAHATYGDPLVSGAEVTVDFDGSVVSWENTSDEDTRTWVPFRASFQFILD